MGFDLTNLTNYVDENKLDLVRKAIMDASATEWADVMAFNKFQTALPIYAEDVEFRIGDMCDITPTGDGVITQVDLAVEKLALDKKYCIDELNSKFLSAKQKQGFYGQDLMIEGVIAEELMSKIQREVSKMFVIGDTNLASGNLSLIDGIVTVAQNLGYGSNGVIDGNVDGVTSVDSSNIIDVVRKALASFPEVVQAMTDEDKVSFHMSPSYFTMLKDAIIDSNLYHYNPEVVTIAGYRTMKFPGYENITIVADYALISTDKMFGSYEWNKKFNTDAVEEIMLLEDVTNEGDKKLGNVVWANRFRLGASIVFPQHFVLFELAAS